MERLDKVIKQLLNKEDNSKETKKALAAVYSEAERRRLLFEGILSNVPDYVFAIDMEQHLIYANKPLLHKLQLSWKNAFGKKIGDENIQLPFENSFSDEIKRAINTQQQVQGKIHSQDDDRVYNYTLVPVFLKDDDEIIVGVCYDITEVTKTKQKLEAELSDMQHLHEISSRLINDTNIDELLDDILEAGIEIMDADKGYLQTIEEDQALHVKSQHQFPKDVADQLSEVTSASDTICAKAFDRQKRLVVPDIRNDEGLETNNQILVEANVQAAQSTPLITRFGRIVGMLSTHWSTAYNPSDHKLQVLDLLARQAADLIEHRRSERALKESEQRYRELNKNLEKQISNRIEELNQKNRQLRALTAELVASEQRERQKFTSILHDDLQQLLVSASMHLSMMQKGNNEKEIAEAIDIIDEAKSVTRNLTKSLSPQNLYERGFESALRWLKKKMYEYHFLDVELDIDVKDVDEKFDVEIGILLFECVRELLLNVVKHAGVDTVDLAAFSEDHRVKIIVVDGGKGFDTEEITSNTDESFGLNNIKKRLEAIGGTLKLQSAPGDGTRVEIIVPFSE